MLAQCFGKAKTDTINEKRMNTIGYPATFLHLRGVTSVYYDISGLLRYNLKQSKYQYWLG
jgi:hypothetical protein